MREIKFKFWDGVKMLDDREDGLPQWMSINKFFKDRDGNTLIPLQYTGLKDKNGKEIYECDFLLGGVTNGTPQLVEWINIKRWIGMADGYVKATIGFEIDAYNFTWDKCEVVGNLYENPELLK